MIIIDERSSNHDSVANHHSADARLHKSVGSAHFHQIPKSEIDPFIVEIDLRLPKGLVLLSFNRVAS